MANQIIQLSARFSTNTERGSVARKIEADLTLAEYIKLAPRIRRMARGNAGYLSEDGAREGLDTVMRTIRFIDAASVRESRAWVSLFGHGSSGKPSGFDHTQVWDWIGHRLVTTEPYPGGVDRVIDWCFDHGWQARRMPEWGMWNPPHTELILCAPPRCGADLSAIVNQMAHHRPLPIDARQTDGKVTRRKMRGAS
ncbi:hypothetical protein [Thiocystis violacea]|uniref:hypothetical protein n=1 Tax=Thiocystis violacea TaxID=13725 RepID=UPI00190528DF|nr:hypothetical protein [Thiocystis violacea]MBK1723220.1 hypothetical protein [Thiocystis violacea]